MSSEDHTAQAPQSNTIRLDLPYDKEFHDAIELRVKERIIDEYGGTLTKESLMEMSISQVQVDVAGGEVIIQVPDNDN